MIKNWQERKAEQNYLTQLDEMLVQRLRTLQPTDRNSGGAIRLSSAVKTPNQISIEINEELDRLESLIRES
jgi:hypothetical protein